MKNMMKQVLTLAIMVFLTTASTTFAAGGADCKKASEVRITGESAWHSGKKIDFEINGRKALLVTPKTPRVDKAWVWRPAFFGAFSNVDKMLLDHGFYLAYCDFTHDYGNPQSVALGKKFYEYMLQTYKLNPKVTLEGLSRGGAYSINFSKANPELVACLYIDAPVCNFASWPSEKSKSGWKDLLKKWGLEKIDDPVNFAGNPFNNIEPIAKAKIPVLLVAGDSDKTVPFDDNGKVFMQRYQKLGGDVKLILKAGCDHHPHGLKDPTPTVEYIENVYKNLKK